MAPKRKTQEKANTPIKKARVVKRASTPTLNPRTTRPRKNVEGVVLTCGQGMFGQLGLGEDVTEKTRFTLVPSLKKVVDICAGGMHTVCLTSNGDVFTFGCDDEGALGRNATDEDSFVPLKVALEMPAVQISAGDNHTAALLQDGRVFAWGCFKDSHGRMGLTTKEPSMTPILIKLNESVEKIASGADHLVLMTVTGKLYSCGCPEQGQLGRVGPRFASRDANRKGMFVAFLEPQPIIILRRKPVFVNIWASTYGTIAKDASNSIYCFGLNNYHQLLSNQINQEGPIWQPIQNGGLRDYDWTKVTGGDHHTLLLNKEGQVYCLGRKEYGRLGLGEGSSDADDVTAITEFQKKKCVDIACGSAVSFAVTDDGQLYGWGMGSNGQLGNGNDDSDVWKPELIKAKALEGRQVLLADAGGQHSVILATVTA